MPDLADVVKQAFGKLGDLFDVFDLSFFASGLVCLSAILYAVSVLAPEAELWSKVGNEYKIIGLLIGSFVLGLVCFSLGRWLRTWALDRKQKDVINERLAEGIKIHGLGASAPFNAYNLEEASPLQRAKVLSRLYTRLWAEVRQSKSVSESFLLLKRYWTMAALCDGLCAALFLWAVVLGARTVQLWTGPQPHFFWSLGGGTLALVGLSLVCAREARRYSTYQVDELLATMAYLRAHPPQPPGP